MQSHHSHSGEFCTHAVNTLEDVILQAIRQKFTSFALTEHMPRDHTQDLYPDEKHLTPADLHDTFARYHAAALRLRAKYAGQIHLLIGFETEFIRPESVPLILRLQREYEFDFVVGSIHHVRGISIDYDSGMWEEAARVCGGQEALFEEYFDEQYELLRGVKPLVVGHFDVLRLWAPDRMVRLRQWAGVWDKVVRNIEFVIEYGGAFELNSAAFRKGFEEPYPTAEIATEILRRGGKFVLSDDSHGVAQVGLNYHRLFEYMRTLGITTYYYVVADKELGVSFASMELASQ